MLFHPTGNFPHFEIPGSFEERTGNEREARILLHNGLHLDVMNDVGSNTTFDENFPQDVWKNYTGSM